MFSYIKNHRSPDAHACPHPRDVAKPVPEFPNKAAFKQWSADPSTNHVFYSLVEGDNPHFRVSEENPARIVRGIVADYDAPVDWPNIHAILKANCNPMPTWIHRTYSDYIRLVWGFEEPVQVDKALAGNFMDEMLATLKLDRLLAGFDRASLRLNQYFEVGTDWRDTGTLLPAKTVRACLFRAVGRKNPESNDAEIPVEAIATEVEKKWPGRWKGAFAVGARGPLFWVDDGIDREGCQVCPDGMLCFSERAHKGFISWRELLGSAFVDSYVDDKVAGIMDSYWFNGKQYYKLIHGIPAVIPESQLKLELKAAGFNPKAKKGKHVSELELATLAIANQNRVDELAPVIFDPRRVIKYNGATILNSSTIEAVQPNGSGDPSKWPFLHEWLPQLFAPAHGRPATDYFFGWLQRFYHAVLERKLVQGQVLILVGAAGRGKSLLSNKVISGLVGGFADASAYLAGKTGFNRSLGRAAAWVIDDTVSAASFQDQRKATELLKRAAANPRIDYQPKFVDAIDIPWTGRVILSLNMDANSLSVIPALDSSNRDKIMALRVADSATSRFPSNADLEGIITQELPHFGRWLLEWSMPPEIAGDARFGVESYIDESIADAAYDNSSRSVIAELVEFFAHKVRGMNENTRQWTGTLTEFQSTLQDLNNGRNIGMSHNVEFVRRGMMTLEEVSHGNPKVRPVSSAGGGGGKVWTIDLDPKYDISGNVNGNHNAGVKVG